MLITIENDAERVTIDTATPHEALSTPAGTAGAPSGSGPGSAPGPADLDAGPAGFDPAGNRSALATAAGVPLAAAGATGGGGGVLDGGAYSA